MPLFDFDDDEETIKSEYIAPEPMYDSFVYHYKNFCYFTTWKRAKEFLEDVNKLFTDDLLELIRDRDLCYYTFEDWSNCWEVEFALDSLMPVGPISHDRPTKFLKIEGEIGHKPKMTFSEVIAVTKEELLERMK